MNEVNNQLHKRLSANLNLHPRDSIEIPFYQDIFEKVLDGHLVIINAANQSVFTLPNVTQKASERHDR